MLRKFILDLWGEMVERAVRVAIDVWREPRKVIREEVVDGDSPLGPGHANALAEWLRARDTEDDPRYDYSPQDIDWPISTDRDATTRRVNRD